MHFHYLSIYLKYPNKPFFFFLSFTQEGRCLTLPQCECRQGSYQIIKQEINKFLQCLIKIKYGDYEVAGVRLKDDRQRVGLDLDYFIFFTNSTMYWNAFTLTLEWNLTQNMNICVSAHKSADQWLTEWLVWRPFACCLNERGDLWRPVLCSLRYRSMKVQWIYFPWQNGHF